MFCVSFLSYRSVGNVSFQGCHFLRPYFQKPPDRSPQCFCGYLHFHDFVLITSIRFSRFTYFHKYLMVWIGCVILLLDVFLCRSHFTRLPHILIACVLQVLCFHYIVTCIGYESHVSSIFCISDYFDCERIYVLNPV
jgi:hypothetical protein